MANTVFSILGKITINYSDAVSGLEKVSKSADDAAENLEDVDKKADDASDSIEDSGNAAKHADNGFSVWKATLANLASQAITAVIQKCEELASKLMEVTSTAVSNYADYEQYVGGVNKLFGDSADAVIEYAENAYSAAQMSANDYLETVTSFSASLISSLGGDTEAAVEYANRAILDMSDNANTFGTDISSIQDAYQGFAKENYTMLDNLKLGYGGTKEEMERLVSEAAAMTDVQEELNLTVEDGSLAFDNIVNAIDVVQHSMGIAGTTANEAGTTLAGTWNKIRALADNILTKVGSELAPTIQAFLNDLSNWMETIDWDAFASEIGDAFSQMLEWIQQVDFDTYFQMAYDGVINFLSGVADFIAALPEAIALFQQLAPVILSAVEAIGALSVISTIISLVQSAISMANPWVAAIYVVVTALIFLWNNCETFRDGVVAVISAITSAVQAVFNFISSVVETISTMLINAFITVVTAWNNLSATISSVLNAIWTTVSTVWNTILSTISGVVNSIWSTISNVFSAISSTISSVLNSIRSIFSSVWNGIRSTVSGVINGIRSTISSGMSAAFSAVSGVLSSISSKFSSIFDTCSSIVSGAINTIKGIMNFSWSLPHLNLPHISISGSFSLSPPSVPHFSISWYKKAMEDGMIMNSPTIFGFDSKSNQFLAGGEAGSETVVGTESLSNMIKGAVTAENSALENKLGQVLDLLASYLPGMASMQLVTDTGALIGEISPGITKEVKSRISREQKNKQVGRGN